MTKAKELLQQAAMLIAALYFDDQEGANRFLMEIEDLVIDLRKEME